MGSNYSVIIPYRDTFDLLVKSIESIPDREDIQIIIVDNSSNPLSIKDLPKRQNSSIGLFFSDSTLGAGAARNEGLKHSNGRWILFLDADDYFLPNAFQVFDQYIESTSDIIYFEADSIKLHDGSKSSRHIPIHEYVQSYLQTGNEDGLRYRFVNPIAKMMRAEFLIDSGITFDEVKASNDMMFSIRTGYAAQLIDANPAKVYMITEGEKNTSLTRTISKENQWSRFQVYIRQYHFMESIGRKDLRFHLLSSIARAFQRFGLKEGLKYLRYASKEKVNIFLI